MRSDAAQTAVWSVVFGLIVTAVFLVGNTIFNVELTGLVPVLMVFSISALFMAFVIIPDRRRRRRWPIKIPPFKHNGSR